MNIELTLTPTRVIGLTLSAPAQGSIEFTPATAGLILQLAPFFKGEPGPQGEPGAADIVSDPVAYYILAKN